VLPTSTSTYLLIPHWLRAVVAACSRGRSQKARTLGVIISHKGFLTRLLLLLVYRGSGCPNNRTKIHAAAPTGAKRSSSCFKIRKNFLVHHCSNSKPLHFVLCERSPDFASLFPERSPAFALFFPFNPSKYPNPPYFSRRVPFC
jgi:hypothetical protein